MDEDNSWRSPSFRQSVVNQINEAIISSNLTQKKSTDYMENHLFSKARNKEEYRNSVARLITHIRRMSNKNKNPSSVNNSQQNQDGQQTEIQDLVNSLQNINITKW